MGVIDTNFKTTTPAATDKAEKPVAQVYANLGKHFDIEQDDGSIVSEFISIPLGIAVDTQLPMVSKSSNNAYNQRVEIKNRILDLVKKEADRLDPGDTEMLTGLDIQLLRRKVVGVASTVGVNPMLQQLKDLKLVG